ncbi:MarR family winged helix-turn-helix transcriptional regulator [Angustibacter aerolatus]
MTDLGELFSDLVRLETELWDAVDRRLRAETDLGAGGYDTLRVIGRTPSCRVLDVARQLSITVGGASKVVDRLEAAGHVARRAHPDDRRSSVVELTPPGADVLARAAEVVDAELRARVGDVLPARPLAQLHTTVRRLRAAQKEH